MRLNFLVLFLVFSLIFTGSAFATLIDGGGFEGSEPTTKWSNCRVPTGSVSWTGSGDPEADTTFITQAVQNGKCDLDRKDGLAPNNDPNYVCIALDSDVFIRDCASIHNYVTASYQTNYDKIITITNDYNSDFSIITCFTESGQDCGNYVYSSIDYDGTTELKTGDVVVLDIAVDNGYFGKDTFYDNIRLAGHILTVTEPVEPIPSFTEFSMRATVADLEGTNVETATVFITLDGDTNSMVYSNGAYRITYPDGLSEGSFAYNVGSNYETTDENATGTLVFATAEYQYLTITPIENIESWSYGSVDFIPEDESKQIIWQVDNNSASAETPIYKIKNSLIDGRQYFIYISSDGVSYAFDDTLTFGSTNENPIQKIWNSALNIYEYSFQDTLGAGETKYYMLTYRNPYKNWQSISESAEWFTNLTPSKVTNLSTIDYDEYSVSYYSNIRDIYIPKVPFIVGDETVAYELQFTAWSDINGTIISAGTTLFDSDSTSNGTLTLEPHRFSFPVQNVSDPTNTQALIKTNLSSSATIFITDYSIVPRGFWTKRLDVRKINGDVLDSILLGGYSKQYLQEGKPFKISTEAYDREGELAILIVEAYFGIVADENRVKHETSFPYGDANSSAESIIEFNEQFAPVIDLNGNAINPADPRTVFIRAKLQDSSGKVVSVQSKSFKFIQYPYFPNDLEMNFYPTEKRLGKNPAGLLTVSISEPGTLEGFEFRIYSDSNSYYNPNYRATLYKGTDFSCAGSNCSFQVKFDDFLLEDVNLTTISIQALLNTENKDPANLITRVIRNFYVTPIIFDIAKIYQVSERIDRTYVNYEEIPLVVILRDQEVSDLSDKIEIYITLELCDAETAGNCVEQTTQYKPTGHIYDSQLGVNYYFFRNLFITDTGELLPDGNFIAINATMTDKTGVRTSEIAVLADRCQGQNYADDFIDALGNPIGLPSFLYNTASQLLAEAVSGCQAGSEQYDKVTTVYNVAQEVRLEIDNAKSRTAPDQEVFFCVSPDYNAVLSKPLEQDILCATIYSIGEKPIDDFRVRITNNFSDLTETGSIKQYKEFNIPYEIIALSDPQLLKNQLEVNSQTTINTVGEFLYYGLVGLAKNYVIGSGLQDKTNFLLGNGIITNVGAEFDLSQDFNNANVPGVVWYRINGVQIINIESYKNNSRVVDDFELIDKRHFLDYLASNNVGIPEKTATLEIVTSDLSSPYIMRDSEGSLVIYEQASNQRINAQNLDENVQTNFSIIPTELSFIVQNTMFFNNFSENDSLSIVIRVKTIIQEDIGNWVARFLEDPVENATQLIFDNILLIAILAVLLIIYLFAKKRM